jgi:uroporphyrinogen-III decarboxylase
MKTADAHGHRRFVVSSGCTLAPDTPAANLHAMLDTVRMSGHTGN